MSDKKSNDSRRKLLKSIAAGSGAVVAGKSLPEAWTKPVVDSVLLPAHAETTGEMVYFLDVDVDGDYHWHYLEYDTGSGQGKFIHVNERETTRREGNLTVKEGAVVLLPITDKGANCGGKGEHKVTIKTISATQIIYDFQHSQSSDGGVGSIHEGVILQKVDSAQTPPSLGACEAASDIRLKTNIETLSTSRKGFNLYKFQYLSDADKETYVGIMAQDIMSEYPEAIVQNDSGFFMVRYDLLGLKMVTLDDWESNGPDSVELKH